jgi:hypothetical protein
VHVKAPSLENESSLYNFIVELFVCFANPPHYFVGEEFLYKRYTVVHNPQQKTIAKEDLVAKDRQIAALKYLVFHSKEIGNTCKRVIATLLDESAGLTKPVKIRFEANTQGFSEKELLALFHDFSVATSCGCKTYLNELLSIAGNDLHFSYGGSLVDYECGLWRRKGKKEPRVIEVTRSELDQIDLSRPGLYPALEKEAVKRASAA